MMKLLHVLLFISSLTPLAASHVRIDSVKYRRLNHHGSKHRRIVDETDTELLDLARTELEWNFCTNAFASKNFTEMTDIVPKNVLFLVKYPNGFKSDNVTCNDALTRTATIDTGQKIILMPVWGTYFLDYADDYLYGICSNSSAESEAARFRDGAAEVIVEHDPNNTKYMVLKIDGISQPPFFLYDNRTYTLKGCPDNRTSEEYFKLQDNPGDLCDADPYQPFNGLDVYPSLGWFGLYNHSWRHKETHTFEFGYSGKDCTTVKYVLTARDVCGFKVFGFGFCPLLWIKHLFDEVVSWLFT